jgi:hypothetical protein
VSAWYPSADWRSTVYYWAYSLVVRGMAWGFTRRLGLLPLAPWIEELLPLRETIKALLVERSILARTERRGASVSHSRNDVNLRAGFALQKGNCHR